MAFTPMPVAFISVEPLCPKCGAAAAPKAPVPPLGTWFDVKCGMCETVYRARWEVPLEPERRK